MIETLNILVVDDDAALRDAIGMILESAGHRVTLAASGPEALGVLESTSFNLVISDLRMDPMDGLTLLANVRAKHAQLPVLLMTAFGDVDKAVAAMRGGACDFLMKPFESNVLLENVRRHATVAPSQDDMIAADPRTRNVLALAAKVAETDASIMLTGESGTGKEVFARYIHQHSRRRTGPFVAINCAAIPENLLEATLFGYEKGSFTGAQTSQARSSRRKAAPSCSMKSLKCRWACKPRCCACCRSAKSSGSVARSRLRWISASSPPPIAT